MLDGVVPYPPELAARYRARGYWEDRPLIDQFRHVFDRHAQRVAIIHDDVSYTYAEVLDRSEHLARQLLALGIEPLDRVVLQLPNVPEFVFTYFALQAIGAIPVLALPQHRYLEIRHFAALSEAKAYITSASLGDFDGRALAQRVMAEVPSLRLTVLRGAQGVDLPPGMVALEALLAEQPRVPATTLHELRIDPTEPCALLVSGGTTGLPKLIPRTHNDYFYNSRIAAAANDIGPDDCLLVVLPIAHNFPLASPGIQGFFLHGARVVLSTSTRGRDVFPLVARHRVTHLELVPALLIRWLDDPELTAHDLSSVRIINSGGQKLQPEVKRRAEATLPNCTVQEVFGMAEGLLMFARLDDPPDVRLETVGRPLSPDDEVQLVDDDGRPVPPGEIGELICRGPYTVRGYYRAPEHNARVFTPDGFFRTGDLMRLHPSGAYVVEGRKKDVINRGGEKISAEEVENLILTHPAVHNVACVPMPDPVLGERMCAFVVPRPGRTLTLEDLTTYLLDKGLAKYKLPERLELVQELPLTAFGKVNKQQLSQEVAQKLQRERGEQS